MTTEQQRKMLEAAAKACGIDGRYVNAAQGIKYAKGQSGNYLQAYFNPLTNHADTAEMCAEVKIDTLWDDTNRFVECSKDRFFIQAHFKDHDNSRLKAWMYAAMMCAAKIGGYTE